MTDIPKDGSPLRMEDYDGIVEIIVHRQALFSESLETSIMMVLMNYGNRFAPAICVNGEWTGHKLDLISGPGIPKCPNGHVLFEQEGMILGWLREKI
ncbi:MAG: hypothetical protein ABWY25_09600 [Paenisporosarcina sp.]